MQPGIVTYTKKEFVGQIDARIRHIVDRLDQAANNAMAEEIDRSVKAAADDPAYLEIMNTVGELFGEAAVDILTQLNYDKWVTNRYAYSTGRQTLKFLEVQPFVWKIGGKLKELLVRHGFPERKPKEQVSVSVQIEDELLYLSGAFGTTRAKFWDMLYPPTKAFVEAIKGEVTIEQLRTAITAYSEALR